MKKLLLIDGSNIMFRAYFATAYSGNLMQNSKGEYTNAIYALSNMLNLILSEDFTHALIAFDKGKETFRHKDYEPYKAKRKKMPDEFRQQLPYVREIVSKLGFFQYETKALEADDIIASIAKQYYDDFDDIEIISNDKDLFQLLNSKVNIRLSKRGIKPEETYTEQTLKEELGLTPQQIPDLKGLMGDSSDNLPGVPGVGEKTALKLLHEYTDLETLLKNQNELKGKLKARISENEKQAIMCKRLATVITDADLDISLDDLAYKGYDTDALIEFYQRMEFHSFIKRLTKTQPSQTTPHITTLKPTDNIKKTLTSPTTIILESFESNYHNAHKIGFAWKNDKGLFYMPYPDAINHSDFTDFLADPKAVKKTFDVKQFYVALMQDNLDLNGVEFDLLLAAYVINPTTTKEDFKVVVQNFDYDAVPYKEDIYGKGAKAEIPAPIISKNYAIQKVIAIESLVDDLTAKIAEQDQKTLLNDIEMPLAKILAEMEFKGIRIDQQALEALNQKLEKSITESTHKIHELAGEPFNVSSPKQLGVILFEKLGLPSYKKLKTGYSTNIDVLTKLKDKHPIIDEIINYRSITKLQSTYVKGLKESIHDDGKIHTIYKQAFTQTGRLSSIEPNLQNIPIRSELGREIRKVFIPEPNDTLIAADYSQIELRVLAHMAKEHHLIEAFSRDEDVHTITGQEIFEKDHITASERRIAKAVNFGIIYGQSAWGLSDDLGIKLADASAFIERYYRRFPEIAKFMDTIIEGAKNNGYVTTLLNRRRYIPEMESRIYAQKEFGKRTAMNAPIQGSAADIIKLAMVAIQKELHAHNYKSTMILQIHDELVFNVVKDEIDTIYALVKNVMEGCYSLAVPLKVSIAKGANLNAAK